MTIPRIDLVQGDVGPNIDITLTDEDTGDPIDVSHGGTSIAFYFKEVDAEDLTATIACTKPNGGADGVVRITWGATDLDEAGDFEGEIQITFNTGIKQTMFEKLRFRVREQLG